MLPLSCKQPNLMKTKREGENISNVVITEVKSFMLYLASPLDGVKGNKYNVKNGCGPDDVLFWWYTLKVTLFKLFNSKDKMLQLLM